VHACLAKRVAHDEQVRYQLLLLLQLRSLIPMQNQLFITRGRVTLIQLAITDGMQYTC
jgi:hypothetical protein